MARKNILGMLAATGLVLGLGGGLEARAGTTPLNGSTNATFGAFTQNATGTVNRVSEYSIQASAGAGGSVQGPVSGWVEDGYSTGNIVFQPDIGYHLTGVTTNGVSAGNSLTNNFVAKSPLAVVGNFGLNEYEFVFKDEGTGVNMTNLVLHGANIEKIFPKYKYSADGKTRSRADSITADGVGVSIPTQ